MKVLTRTNRSQQGFTIIELLIATTVFGVLLLIASTAVVGLSRQYYKGLIQARTQEVARNISEEIANNIRYSTGGITSASVGDINYTCIANRRYMYRQGRKLGSPGTPAVLIRDEGCGTALPPLGAPIAGQVELMGDNMRLALLRITNTGSLYTISVRILYGDDDLLCSPSADGDCASSTPTVNAGEPDVVCKGQAGSQFCATAETSITVVRRL